MRGIYELSSFSMGKLSNFPILDQFCFTCYELYSLFFYIPIHTLAQNYNLNPINLFISLWEGDTIFFLLLVFSSPILNIFFNMKTQTQITLLTFSDFRFHFLDPPEKERFQLFVLQILVKNVLLKINNITWFFFFLHEYDLVHKKD